MHFVIFMIEYESRISECIMFILHEDLLMKFYYKHIFVFRMFCEVIWNSSAEYSVFPSMILVK